MRRKSLLWQLYPTYLAITLVALMASIWYAGIELRRFHFERTAASLESQAHLLEFQVRESLEQGSFKELDLLCKDLGRKAGTRITVILPSGQVVADALEDPARMENHALRDEVQEALQGQKGTATRRSATVREEMFYVALPLKSGDQILAVIRTSTPLTAIDLALKSLQWHVLLATLIIMALASVILWAASKRISRPLAEMKAGAERMAGGDLHFQCPIPDIDEIGGLAEAINRMAVQLNERIATAVKQRNEMEAMLSSMVEGVVAVDSEERLITLNQAATRFLGVEPSAALGRSLQEAVRNAELQRFIKRTLASPAPVENVLVLDRDQGERFFQAHGTALRDAQGGGHGALIVLHDITHLQRLERVRRDFVANVSHELRTPITAIKGSAETLLTGALHEPKDAERFLGIIARQADRLNAIIVDLLTLSKVEQGEEKGDLARQDGPLGEVLQAAAQACAIKAAVKEIRIEVACEEGLRAAINAPLLEQALVNLIDNAIQYSEPGSRVEVRASRNGSGVQLQVRDQGCGIAREHLDRIFERFYRVDQARSRKLGGTGLGLSIVKHIAQVHGGSVSVESTPGQGSVFTLAI